LYGIDRSTSKFLILPNFLIDFHVLIKQGAIYMHEIFSWCFAQLLPPCEIKPLPLSILLSVSLARWEESFNTKFGKIRKFWSKLRLGAVMAARLGVPGKCSSKKFFFLLFSQKNSPRRSTTSSSMPITIRRYRAYSTPISTSNKFIWSNPTSSNKHGKWPDVGGCYWCF